MKLSIVTGVCGALEVTEKWVDITLGNCATEHEVVVVSNGNKPEESEKLRKKLDDTGWPVQFIDVPEVLGSTKTFNLGVKAATGDYVAMLHNDLMVEQDNWDDYVLSFIKSFQTKFPLGIMGFHGSQRLGRNDIYRTPYELVQLARGSNFSNMVDAESHGVRSTRPVEVVTLDGMALICEKKLFEEIGGFDEKMIHHMYDHDLCLKAKQIGRRNVMLPVVVRHLNGQTANASRYNEAFESLGRDSGVHAQSHAYFYQKWYGKLPVVL